MSETSILPGEVEQFAAHAGRWWDPEGPEAMLHKLNPVRLKYIRDQVDRHWQADETGFRPLEGKSVLDVGCGAGLLAEPLARLGAKVTAVDASEELVAAAATHAEASGLEIDYRACAVEDLEGTFDLVTSLEVVEHVAEPRAFVRAVAERVAPGGLLILSTPNRTAWSRLLTITLAEGFGRVPRGTHDFARFIVPDELCAMVREAGLSVVDVEGIAFTPLKGIHLSDDTNLNYLVCATKGAGAE
jgi:2-polyprenyl-6-hydroxyphenyl methylase/3-demethylubiquinone-9 3-methyltransferase